MSALVGWVLSALVASAATGAIGPEAVHDMQADPTHSQRVEVISLDADGVAPQPIPSAKTFPRDVSLVYACWSLSQRHCKDEVLRAQEVGHDKALYLTGTPKEWVTSGVTFSDMPAALLKARLANMLTISVRDLSSARKDGTEFTLVDVRSGLRDGDARIEGALNLPPVLLTEKQGLLPKNGWIVLYDGGNHVAESSAAELRQAGFSMAVALDGGYPAWVTSDQR